MILTVTPNPCVDKTVFIGDLNLGEKIRSRKYTCVPGGKGTNVSRAVKALGRATRAMVIVGGYTGAHVAEMILNQDGVEVVPIWVASPTRTITTVLEEPIHRQTAFFEPGSLVTDKEAAELRDVFEKVVGEAKVVTFNGTVSDAHIEGLYKDLISIAKAHGVITLLDSHGPEFRLGVEAVPYMVKPNVVEAEEAVGYLLDTDTARWKAVDFFHAHGVELVVISLGRDGALVSRGNERFQVVPPRIEAVNPVGSGDALVAGFAIGLMEDMPLEEMAILACAAGTANAMSWDIGHFTKADVENIIPQIQLRRVGASP